MLSLTNQKLNLYDFNFFDSLRLFNQHYLVIDFILRHESVCSNNTYALLYKKVYF